MRSITNHITTFDEPSDNLYKFIKILNIDTDLCNFLYICNIISSQKSKIKFPGNVNEIDD